MSDDTPALSTTALAKRLRLPIQQLFGTLRDYGWIERKEDQWSLTSKGSLHGGQYRNSERFGRYIVWPEELAEHPMLAAIESDQRLSSRSLSQHFNYLSAAQINRHFAEMGLLRRSSIGLELTALGEHFGGRQEQDAESALLTVSWPQAVIDDPVVRRELTRLGADGLMDLADKSSLDAEETPVDDASSDAATGGVADLFDERTGSPQAPQRADSSKLIRRQSIDGRFVESILQLRVADWLYGAQLACAHRRQLPCEEPLHADFYVPAVGLYVECWERDVPTDTLSRRLRVREVCRELGLPYLEIPASDIDRVDEILTNRLAELGAPR
ncbi:MAG: hypothetical protein AAF098_10695 [Pseudomonadota bacterium]